MMKKPYLFVLSGIFLLTGCQPKVQVEAPDKPIVINLNVKIEHEIRVKVEKDAENLLENRKGLFE